MDEFDYHWGNGHLKLHSNTRPSNSRNSVYLDDRMLADTQLIMEKEELKSKADFAEEKHINYLPERIKSLQS